MHAEAENADLDDDLIDDSAYSEADGDTRQVASSSDGIADVNEQGHQLVPPPQNEAEDDLDQFASSLDDVLLVEGEEVAPPQKEARKCLDPFEAAFADEAE